MYNNLWLKRVWIPLWVIQLIFVLILLVVSSFALYGVAYIDENDPTNDYDNVYTALNAVAAVYIAICGLTVLFTLVEIILLARKRLNPVVAVSLESILFLIWLIIFVLVIVGVARAPRQAGSALGFIFIIVVLATSLGKLIYSSVILHRYRKNRSAARGTYSAPGDAETGLQAYTAYNPSAGAPPNPFRDSSRDPSPNPTTHQQRPTGEAAGYYDSAPHGSYEMQQSVGRY
ncbi:hypothetical protein HII31_02677 [Pseudocercospora fuligena]|uniref:MARVEL domain-containing protein n=1 Tax=Pseudocercospora fuligena TaxID=685502 RepID=A0A8H6RPE5_9PEZI|nr:hypothetical protein HII31_02677 [Pseudocercospora fuligena]